jgi:uncharacterized protein (DUF1786 family)
LQARTPRGPVPSKILAIDIGQGTQDIFIYDEKKPVENCVQMVLPSPTQIIALKVRQATALKKNIFLFGSTMGGGPSAWAIQRHLKSGLKVYATEPAALTLRDNLEEICKAGLQITRRPPSGVLRIHLRDMDLPSLEKALQPFGVSLPQACAVAVQDHGFSPGGSNRRFRFQYWETFLLQGGSLQDLIYRNPPPSMTRMASIQKDAPGAMVMDTCAAALWGILCDPKAVEHLQAGILAVNLGNQHTLGALIQGERVWGIFEHHTGRMTRDRLISFLERFPQKRLSNDAIFKDGGHGCAVHPDFSRKRGYRFIAVTGPRRSLAEGLGFHMAAPYGNMMLTGCFGLIAALKAKLTAEARVRRAANQKKTNNF